MTGPMRFHDKGKGCCGDPWRKGGAYNSTALFGLAPGGKEEKTWGADPWSKGGADETPVQQAREHRRKREMVICGFERSTPKAEVIKKAHAHMKLWGERAEECDVFTIGPMVTFAIVRFNTLWDKRLFEVWWADNGETMKQHAELWISDNVEQNRRILEIAPGKVKKASCELQERRTDVTVDWWRGQVFVGRDMVAKCADGNMILMKGEVLMLNSKIDDLIKGSGISGVQIVLSVEE